MDQLLVATTISRRCCRRCRRRRAIYALLFFLPLFTFNLLLVKVFRFLYVYGALTHIYTVYTVAYAFRAYYFTLAQTYKQPHTIK